MKEARMASTGGERNGRSASEKEKTKMRERQRRGITTKIFQGLRKHGGYHLSPRSDINEVLRELAREAGWVVEPDGTTYRSTTTAVCPACGAVKRSATPTPSSSIVVTAGCGGGSGGGECSTTTSPHRFPNIGESLYFSGGCSGRSTINTTSSSQDLTADRDIPLALHMYGGLFGGLQPSAAAAAGVAVGAPSAYQQQQRYLQEAMASNQNTPVGSPLRRV